MNYTEFIKGLQKELNENGVRISQDKLKTIFRVMSEYILENIGFVENIKIKEFISFELQKISPRKLPDGTMSKEQYGMKVKLSGKYKERLKKELNK